jgi:hypothetical protein
MVQAFTPTVKSIAHRPMFLEEFLAWDEGSDRLYGLVEGMPIPIYDPTADHEDVADVICDLLKAYCLAQKLPYVPKRSKQDKINFRLCPGVRPRCHRLRRPRYFTPTWKPYFRTWKPGLKPIWTKTEFSGHR